MVLEKTLESPLDCKEIKPVNPKGDQSWIILGGTDIKAPILWPPDAESRLIEKDPDAGKDWGQEEKGKTEDEMVGWHHWLRGHEFEQTLGQRSLVCCSPWDFRVGHDLVTINNNSSIYNITSITVWLPPFFFIALKTIWHNMYTFIDLLLGQELGLIYTIYAEQYLAHGQCLVPICWFYYIVMLLHFKEETGR